MITFYVCSYGGCGSKLLSRKLRRYGRVKHLHSRKPPDMLEYTGKEIRCHLWFNGIKIPPSDVKNYKVIYIYRNPAKSILSRFENPNHLRNIQTSTTTKLNDILESKKDLYGIQEFYENYTKPNPKRNYQIYCIKYEDLFQNSSTISRILGVGPLLLHEKTTNKNKNDIETKLEEIYKNVIDDMNKKKFLFIN
jgi:uncharacterized protein YlbG (UPF0298 family)